MWMYLTHQKDSKDTSNLYNLTKPSQHQIVVDEKKEIQSLQEHIQQKKEFMSLWEHTQQGSPLLLKKKFSNVNKIKKGSLRKVVDLIHQLGIYKRKTPHSDGQKQEIAKKQ